MTTTPANHALANHAPAPTDRETLVVKTGAANLASVLAGLRRAATKPRVIENAAEIQNATHVVLPGVGAFGYATRRLRETGLDEILRQRVLEGRPTLAICLGLQLLAEESEESPGARGLGAFNARVARFSATTPRVPQLGWNAVDPDAHCRLLQAGFAYYANSYRLETCPPGWNAAYSDYGGRFVAALERGGVLACQFHPELSGAWGLDLIRRWLAGAEQAASENASAFQSHPGAGAC